MFWNIVGIICIVAFFILWFMYILANNYEKSKYKDKIIKISESELNKLKNENQKEKNDLQNQINLFKEKEQKLELRKSEIERELQREKDFIRKEAARLLKKEEFLTEDIKSKEELLLKEKSMSQKWLAGMVSDFLTLPLSNEIDDLLDSNSKKKHEYAIKLTDCKQKIKALTERNKMLEYELKYLYELYPELEETEIESDDNIEIEPLENTGWLTKEEWENLTDLEKNELAFDRYKNRHKTKWQIGRDFEMFVGYKCESEGKYKVEYHGIKHGVKDLGIDLIAKKENETLIIQCKYWSTQKLIHEKHLCQLYGTSIKYQLENPEENVIPVFVCHNQLSDIAKTFAEKLNIEVHENVELGEYPSIKCCLNSGIYHLPFDMSYDQTEDCIKVMTVKEAEKLGYRRSFKWRGYN